MKIGILTYHRTLNYGACLQAVATRLVLEKMGHEVYYVDYWPEYHQSNYDLFSWLKLKTLSPLRKIKYIIQSFRNIEFKRKRIKNFSLFRDKYILPYCKSEKEEFDIIIYGSDQIWRKQKELSDYNSIYFGDNSLHAKKHISYAASMGVLPKSEEEAKRIKSLVSHLDKISVRESDLKVYLESLHFKDVEQVLDPTLLLEKEEWLDLEKKDSNPNEKYVLVYIMSSSGFDLEEINKFAKRRSLKVKILRGFVTDKETRSLINTVDPCEFLSLIKNADFVFSSSFHGLAFSLIYEKQFVTAFTNNSGRAKSLLESLGLDDRLLQSHCKLPSDFDEIDYNLVNQKIVKLRNKSIEFLKSI